MPEQVEQTPMSDNDDKILAEQNAFHLVKALDLIDECYHYLKANPTSKENMNYNKWESLVEETNYMREFNAAAEHERINRETEYSPNNQDGSLSDRLKEERNKTIAVERPKAWNEAIDACIAVVTKVIPNNHFDRVGIHLELKKLKHKQP